MIKIILKDGTEYENDPTYGYNLDNVKDIWECLNIVGKYCFFTKNIKNLNFITSDDMNAALNGTPEKDGEMINIYKDDVKDIVEI
ncbi:MAG: hypothetical protein RSA01_08120 [Clostridium sp.]|uniref:hypothetical protein n=1 Tax=Clostridium sp. TaxID=1506 RepID=UPI002FC6546A